MDPAIQRQASVGALLAARGVVREVYLVGACLLVALVAQLVLAGSRDSFRRPLWTDELVSYSQLAVLRGDAGHGLAERLGVMARSPDATPPTYYALLSAWSAPGSLGTSAAWLRGASLLSAAIALAATYGLLRLAFPVLPAAAGAAAVWAHPSSVAYAFELRAYAPWLALQACLCWLLGLVSHPDRRTARRAKVLLGITAALSCSIHYFGVLSLGAALGGWLVVEWLRDRRVVLAAWPALFGPLALAGSLPFLVAQWESNAEPTWLEPPSGKEEVLFAVSFVSPALLGVAAACAGVSLLLPKPTRERVLGTWRASGVAAAAATGLLPLGLVVLGRILEPATLDRYMLPAVIAGAPLVAFLVSASWRPLGGVVLVAALVLSSLELQQNARSAARFTARQIDSVELLNRLRPDELVVFEHVHVLAPLLWLDRSLVDRTAVVEHRPAAPSREEVYIEGWNRAALESWGWPRRLTLDELPNREHFAMFSVFAAPRLPRDAYQRFDVGRLERQLWFVRRKDRALDEAVAASTLQP
jgi:hypothetical protein